MSLKGIRFNRTPSLLKLIFIIFEKVCLNDFCVESNPSLNTVQLMVFEVLMFHENTELLPYLDSYELYPVDNDPTVGTTHVLVGIPARNQLVWVELDKED